MAGLLEGRAGLVTGAGSGIGRASAMAFAAEGARVVVSDIDQASGTETVRMIHDAGGAATFMLCDVSVEEQVKELVAEVVDAYGRLDWAHNNAGIGNPNASLAEMDTDAWNRTLGIDLAGVFFCMKHEIPAMIANGGGAIVNTSSAAGLRGSPGLSPYTASKWGVNGLTKTAALEYASQGVRINAICPGPTLTPVLERWMKEAPERFAAAGANVPIGRLSRPEEQASAAVWLCSDKASYITGITLPVDGGSSAR
jgi:NAD(P)-dependent dehydrogenase (short-subunit alcohol dehydrogenase family)